MSSKNTQPDPNSQLPQNVGSLLKGHFFAGMLVLLPLGVIAWIIAWVMGMLWKLHTLVPEALRPENYFSSPTAAALVNLLFTLAVTLGLAIAISLLGWSSRHYVGQKALEFIGDGIQRIPVIRSVYSALDQLLRTFSAGGGQQFNRVVYIEYPRKGIWALAFVTSAARGPGAPEHHLNVYVPTTPNPTSGFHLIVSESEVRESHLSVEEAFKTILSLGIAQSDDPSRHLARGGAMRSPEKDG